MLDKIFSIGNRKVIAMVLGIIAVLFGDKLGITMTEEMNDAVVQMVAIFTGGNVLSKFAFALLNKGGVKLPQLEEASKNLEAPPVDHAALSSAQTQSQIDNVAAYAQRIAQDATKHIQDLQTRCQTIEGHIAKQTASINDLIALLNRQGPPQGAAPTRVPTPNDLYNQG